MSNRTPIAAANWKMNLVRADAARFAEALEAMPPQNCEAVVFPSSPLLQQFSQATRGIPGVAVGGQDLHPIESGAHTGDTSAAQLLDAGCSWALCGHSERRADHGETDTLVGRKLGAGLRAGLQMMLCIGESSAERQAGATQPVLERQLRLAWSSALESNADAQHDDWAKRLSLAYEPIWAIGTGQSATPDLAQEAHAFLRHLVSDMLGAQVAGSIRILYGGSVKPSNCRELIEPADIDGFLVGGASLDPSAFLDIIAGCA